jgi:hypothetical protein
MPGASGDCFQVRIGDEVSPMFASINELLRSLQVFVSFCYFESGGLMVWRSLMSILSSR